MAFTLHRRTLTIASLAATAAALSFASPAAAAGSCTKYASPAGNDSSLGTELLPYRTAQKLAYSLKAGDVGCLRAGTYTQNVELTVRGTAAAPITLQSYPGERAKIVGELAVRAGADYTRVTGLDLNGKNEGQWPSPAISADHVVFEGNDVTNDHTGICFLIGTSSGRPQSTIIRDNRIHNCGQLPATNLQEGIYVSKADDTQILGNVIYDVADMGVQLYPDAQRTIVRGNVIDGNGEGIIISGESDSTANDSVIENNVITNSKIRDNVESYWHPGYPVGHGNVVRNNCIHGGVKDDGDGGISRQVGFTASGNIIADPKYVNRAAKDFRLAADSPCAGILGGEAAPPAPDPEPAPPAGTVTLEIPQVVAQIGQLVPATGAVVLPVHLQPATTGVTRTVLVQRRTKRGWRTVARTKLRKGKRFRTRVRVQGRRGQRVVRMRAVVRDVAHSRVRRVKVRRR